MIHTPSRNCARQPGRAENEIRCCSDQQRSLKCRPKEGTLHSLGTECLLLSGRITLCRANCWGENTFFFFLSRASQWDKLASFCLNCLSTPPSTKCPLKLLFADSVMIKRDGDSPSSTRLHRELRSYLYLFILAKAFSLKSDSLAIFLDYGLSVLLMYLSSLLFL